MTIVHVVTGATGGIGRATAQALARPGATVAIVARTRASGDQAAAQLRAGTTGADVDVLVADLSVLAGVTGLAEEIRQRYPRVDVLVNNAGTAFAHGATADGLDPVFATNHLAPFLLTHLLRDRLGTAAGGPSRVVVVSSALHRQVKQLPWDQLGVPDAPINRYAISKLCNVLFVRELARRLEGTGVTANAADPGFVRSGLGRGATGMFRVFLAASRPLQASPVKGARTSVFLATDPSVAGVTGGYFAKCEQVTPGGLALDDEAAERLWQLSADKCGIAA